MCVEQSIGEKIGRGAFAQVFKARWGETGFFVAVKKFDMSQVAKDTIDSVLVCHTHMHTHTQQQATNNKLNLV